MIVLLVFYALYCPYCQSLTTIGQTNTINLNILVLVPWPNVREDAGFDLGLELIPGARIATKEINNRSDVLPGYRINIIEAGHEACGVNGNSLGQSNLIHHAINPKKIDSSTAAIAVAGLYCSPSTQAIAPLVNLNDAQLIQLSASNSPTFNRNYQQFPHLWRFLQSADVYVHMMLYLMDEYEWSKIAIVGNFENDYYYGITTSIIGKLHHSNILYQGELLNTIKEYQTLVLTNLVTSNARIVLVAAPANLVAGLLCEAFEQDMTYPKYAWIVADWGMESLIQSGQCSEAILRQVLEGCILSEFSLTPHDESLLLSGYHYDTYIEKYTSELELVKQEYEDLINQTDTVVGRSLGYSGILYDQIWALSLALNNSLSELAIRNLSLADYGFGQPLITEIIERNLEKLSFQGASSYIDFTNQQEVRTPINIYQVREGSDILVGDRVVFDSNYSTVTDIDLIFSADLDDEIPSFYQTVPVPVTVTLAVLEVLLFIFITVVLFLFIKHRNAKHIKAKSVKISLMMFIAFYAAGSVSNGIQIILSSVQLSAVGYSILCQAEFFITYSAAVLLYGTIYLKIQRIYKIFHNKEFKMYSWMYSNWLIILRVSGLILVGNMFLVVAMGVGVSPMKQAFENVTEPYESIQASFQYPYCHIDSNSLSVVYGFFLYLTTILVLILYYSSRMSHIQLSEFKETKTINIFLAITSVLFALAVPFNVVFLTSGKYVLYLNVVQFCTAYLIVVFALIMLFIPSLRRLNT